MQVTKKEYHYLHVWLHRKFKKKKVCEFCGRQGYTEWSNISGEYLGERDDFQELCKPCHIKYDKERVDKPPLNSL